MQKVALVNNTTDTLKNLG